MRQLAFLFAFPMLVQAASFDCSKAANAIEKLICNSAVLSQLDSDLNNTYETTKSTSDRELLIYDQKKWLKNIRNKCNNEQCLEKSYRARIVALKTWNDPVSPTKDIYGTYVFKRIHFINDPASDESEELEDCLSLKKSGANEVTFQFLVNGTNGSTCEMDGKLKLSEHALNYIPQYVPPAKNAEDHDIDDRDCKLQIKFTSRTLWLEDSNNSCLGIVACGHRASFGGATFLRTEKSAKQCGGH